METSFDTILLNLVPSNIAADLAADNIVAIIIIAVAVAVAYVSISSEEGEDKVLVIKKLIEAVKKVIFNILAYVTIRSALPDSMLCKSALKRQRGAGTACTSCCDGICCMPYSIICCQCGNLEIICQG